MNTRLIKQILLAGMWLLLSSGPLSAWQPGEGDDVISTPAPPAGFGGLLPGLSGSGSFNFSPQGVRPRQVTGRDVMITWAEQNDELRGFSTTLGEWETMKIMKQDTIVAVVGGSVAAVRVGDSMAAFSGEKGWWDLIPLSAGSKAVAVVSDNLVQLEDNGHLYTFAAAKGRWTSPTDPDLRGGTSVVVSQRPEQDLKHDFDDWFASLPRYKAHGIHMMMNDREVQVEADRQSLLREAEEILKRIPLITGQPQKTGSNEPADNAASVDARIVSLRTELQALELSALASPPAAGQGAPENEAEIEALRKTVEQTFDVRQQLQQLEAQRMRQKLLLIEANLQARQKNRDRIVDRRLEELLDLRDQTTSPDPNVPLSRENVQPAVPERN